MNSLLGCAVASMALATGAQAQVWPTFSIDMQSQYNGNAPGPNTGVADSFFGIQIDEGSILTPATLGPFAPNPPGPGFLQPPGLVVGSLPGAGGMVPGGLGFAPPPFGLPAMELDALSYGHDLGIQLMFSVDEWAGGDPLAPPQPPNMRSEGPLAGLNQAAADVFVYNGAVNRTPLPLPGLGPNNRLFLDGDGLGPPQPGLGLLEPMAPGCLFACGGDNLDALDINSTQPDPFGPIYFSLDSGFIDPLDGPPLNGGTAIANGFSGGDVLVTQAGGAPNIYAPANQLGLDIVNGFDTDDLDALILIDDGDKIFDPSVDRILFSVRRGSSVIGQPDSLMAIRIEEGDVLSLPIPGGNGLPSMYIPAESLGLATVRSGTNQISNFGDELDALDLFLRGDLDGDGFVGINDLNIILAAWNQGVPPGNPQADVNGDGFVGIGDLNVVLGNWNAGAPLPPGAGAAVPEPASLTMIGLGTLAMLRRRR